MAFEALVDTKFKTPEFEIDKDCLIQKKITKDIRKIDLTKTEKTQLILCRLKSISL